VRDIRRKRKEREKEREIIGRLEWTFVAIDSVMMFSSFLQTNKQTPNMQ
jgi:hypothetical protein